MSISHHQRCSQGWNRLFKSPVCTRMAEGTHHILPRGRGGGLPAAERDGPTPVPACNRCNSYVSEHPLWSKENGWLLSPKGRAA